MAENVTQILQAINQGDRQAAEQLLPLVYDELRKLAAHRLAQEGPGQTLQATALVHEAYVRLVGEDGAHKQEARWDHQGHFFAAAAEAMRRILVDRARAKSSLKRGGGRARFDMLETDLEVSVPDEELVALDDALTRLAENAPVAAELVKLRYFAGLSLQEAAASLGISRATASRHWAYARAWLYKQMTD